MVNNIHLNFMREKIGELKSALFYSQSKSVLKLPASVVDALHVDEIGQIWLQVPRPVQDVKEFERNFPVRLNFYRKGKPFYFNVEGKATIVLEPGELDEMQSLLPISRRNPECFIFVKVEVTDTEYHETAITVKPGLASSVTAMIQRWISQETSGYKPLAAQ